jgi:hypothetical protein
MQLTAVLAEPVLEVRPTRFGKGVFARKQFRAGERILQFRGRLYSRREYLGKVNPEKCHYMQIGENAFLGPTTSPDNFVNHCCEPNAGLKIENGKAFLVAIATIQTGNEITFDYSTSMAEDHWEMDCACGVPTCRSRVRDFKYLSRALQQKYIDLGIAPEFVLRSAGLEDPHDLFHAGAYASANLGTSLNNGSHKDSIHAGANLGTSLSNGFRKDDVLVGGNLDSSVNHGSHRDDVRVGANLGTSLSNAQSAH